uniref:Superoxide dismutase [Cu-Zn] n=2 Tax=Ixodes ricinus TaxID=34613 RepID=V5HA35_IXORI
MYLLFCLFYCLWDSCSGRRTSGCPRRTPFCVLNTTNISGVVRFVQTSNWSVEVTANVIGLPPGPHGFHIHQYGDITKGCASAGGHYNPLSMNHGGPDSPVRHVGDLGNIVANTQGIVVHCHEYHNFTLQGTHSILGRSIVIHANADDYGLGGHNDSLTTGHAGARLACCSIVVSQLSVFFSRVRT